MKVQGRTKQNMGDKIRDFVNFVKRNDFYPDIRIVEGISSNPEIKVAGRRVLLFCSANYLGLAGDPEIKNAVINGVIEYGIHPSGARLLSGTLDIHEQLEKSLAAFKQGEDAITFTTGALANIGAIPAVASIPKISRESLSNNKLVKEDGCIISDELNHASIIDGVRLADAQKYIYRHVDLEDLEAKLKLCGKKSKLIITDGVFSMDGDIAPLPDIILLAKKYGAGLMVDDAHATGILGKRGGGTSDHYGIEDGIDLNMGTFSKAFGSLGGFIVGERYLMEYLRFTARTYIFSGALPGPLAAGALKALEIIKTDSWRRKTLWKNTRYLADKVTELGLDIMDSKTPIIPIFIGKEETAIRFARQLFDKGIFAPCIRWPAVPKGEARIRLSVIATHTKGHLDYLISVLKELALKNGLLD